MNITRREFLGASAAVCLLGNGRQVFGQEPPPAQPPFRVLYNNDLTNTVSCVSPWHQARQPFRPEMLQATVDEVAGTGVQVHLLQPGLGWIPFWKSSVYPAAEHYQWYQQRTGAPPDTFADYMLQGGDMVQVFVDRCRERGQSPFISLRVNDAHHLEHADAKDRTAIWASKFVFEHPEYRIGSGQSTDQRVLNWAHPEVPAHKLSFVKELCANYAFDGFELDFMRFYSMFDLHQSSSEQRREIVTNFVRQVREALDRTSSGSKRRWLCARVPCYLAGHDALGIDLPVLVAAGLDIITLSASYFTVQQTDLAAICKLVPTAAVYLEMCHTIWNAPKPAGVKGYDTFQFRRTTSEQYYTAAHLAYARGAAGVSAFNFAYYREHGGPGRGPFCEPPFQIFAHLGDVAWLASQPQHYFLTSGWGNPFTKAAMPRLIASNHGASFTLDMAPPKGGWQHGGRLRIQAATTLADTNWRVSLNGTALTASQDVSEPYPNPYPSMLGQPDQMRAWQVPAALLVDGRNQIDLHLDSGPQSRVEYLDVAVS